MKYIATKGPLLVATGNTYDECFNKVKTKYSKTMNEPKEYLKTLSQKQFLAVLEIDLFPVKEDVYSEMKTCEAE